MSYQDKTLVCVDCNQQFTFSAEDQAYFAEKGYNNDPKRCTSCRQARRANREANGYGQSNSREGYGYGRQARQMYPATCGHCGRATEVPFQPRGDRPVYCGDCYRLLSITRTNDTNRTSRSGGYRSR